MTGNDQLKEQLETLRRSLRAFDDPIVEETPGLRLMQSALKEREEHIARTISDNETCAIEITLVGAPHSGTAVPATLVAYLLDAVAAAVEAAGLERASRWPARPADTDLVAALACHVEDVSVSGDEAVLRLTRPPGPVRAQVADPDSGAPLFEHAAVDAFDAIDADVVPQHLVPSLHGLAEAISGGEMTVRWTIEPFVLDPAEGQIDQAEAQRLVARATD